MQQTANNPPVEEPAATTAAVQQVQTPIKFDVPVFEGDSAASWLRWSQRVVYQARSCGFEADLAAAEGEEPSVGADVFDRNNVDPERLRSTHAAWTTLINNCKIMTLEIAQRSEAPKKTGSYFDCRTRLTGKRCSQGRTPSN